MLKKIILVTIIVVNIFAYDITTGGASGTYIKFGKQIKQYVADEIEMNMNVLTSNGSVDNINKMSLNDNIRFAIVQHDVINSMKNSSMNKSKLLVRSAKVLLPLYFEEIHFVVRRNSSMTYIKDIKNKKINAGKEGSGTFSTTTLLYKELFNQEVDYNNLTNYKKSHAFQELLQGNIDVVVVVAGQPTGSIESLSNKFKLLKLNPGLSSNNYYPTTIKADSYHWLNQNTPTFAVKAYLVTYDTSSKKFEGQIRRFAKRFRKNINLLRNEGHPKWRKVDEDLSKKLPAGWEYYEPFRDAWKYAKCTEDEELMGLCK